MVSVHGDNQGAWFVDLSSVGASVAYFVTCLYAYKIAINNKDLIISTVGMTVFLRFLVFLLTSIFYSNMSLSSYYSLLFWVIFGVVIYMYTNRRQQRNRKLTSL